MKNLIRGICFIGFLLSQSLFAAPTVFEDFSGSMSEQKFDETEQTMEINSSGELALSSKAKSFLRENSGKSVFLKDTSDALMISADLKVIDLSLGNLETQQAELRILRDFYYSEAGRVFVSLSLGDRGNGLEAWYSIYDDTYEADGRYVSSVLFDQGSLALDGLSLNTVYKASISYDGDKGFTFVFNNQTPVVTSGPIKSSESFFWVGVGTRLRFGQNNSTPNIYEDEKTEDGTTAYIIGTVDNVTTDIEDLGDDFSAANLDKWNNVPQSKIITDGQLEMAISQTNSSRHTSRVSINQLGLKYFGAKVTLSSESTPSETARVRARIVHYLGNDTYDVSNGDIPNGFEGSIFTQIVLERLADGSFRAFAYISRALDANFDTEAEVIFQILTPTIPVAYDVQYELAIEQVDKVVNYIIDGETLLTFDLATSDVLSDNLYSVTEGGNSQLNARVQDGPGRVVALFDDVTTDLMPSIVNLTATNSDDEQVALPEEVIVNVGEQVSLTADSSNASDIIKFLWEQISGTGVDIPAASGRSSSIVSALAKVIGTENTLSFTIPAGSDTENLAFKLTTVDKSGLEAVKTFTLTVDNSKDSTLSPADPVDPVDPVEPSSSGGGGSFNFFFIFMLLLTLTAKARLRSRS